MITPEALAKSGTEHGEQAALFCWAQQNIVLYPMLVWMHAIPNGGKRDAVTGGRLKAEGVKSGVADVFLPLASAGYHGLYIEMKRAKGKLSDVTPHQIDFHSYCMANNYAWVCAFGWESAVHFIKRYVEGKRWLTQ